MNTTIDDTGGGGVGVELEIVAAGDGAMTLVVAPGFGGGISAYEAFIERLAREHHVVGFSPRGFGRSGWAAPYAVGDWVVDLLDVVADRAHQPVIAVGHSFGAFLALGAAAAEPSRFCAVISLDQIVELEVFVPLARHLNGYWQQVRRAVVDAGGDPDALAARLADVVAVDGRLGDTRSPHELAEMARRWITQDPAVLASLTDERSDHWMNDPVLADLPRRVQCPVFFVNGDPDAGSIVSAEQGHRNCAAFPGSDQVRLGGLGHQLGMDLTPEWAIEAMRPFLDQLT